MKNNKSIVITAVVTFIVTTAFYLTPLGDLLICSLGSGSQNDDIYSKLNKIDSVLEQYYINEYDTQKMEDCALEGYLYGVGDPYTSYVSKSNYEAFMESMGAEYQGIGVSVINDADGTIKIVSVMDNSPAKKSGMRVDDNIVAVEGQNVTSENYMQLINVIKGKDAQEGDNDVVITVKRGNESFDLTLVRETLHVITASSKMLPGGIGYLRITDFGENTYDEYKTCLAELENAGAKGLIIDLRNNGGGMLTTVVSIADTLLPKGNILTIKSEKTGANQIFDSDDLFIDIPLCVIVNQNSASASEVLAGALKDHKRATLVGEKTYGKGVVQSMINFDDGSAFKVTTSKYYTPSGECIDQKGIIPDVEIALEEEYKHYSVDLIPEGKDIQLDAAIEQVSMQIK